MSVCPSLLCVTFVVSQHQKPVRLKQRGGLFATAAAAAVTIAQDKNALKIRILLIDDTTIQVLLEDTDFDRLARISTPEYRRMFFLAVLVITVNTATVESSTPFVAACDSSPSQLWSLSSNKLQSLLSSSCLSTVDCNPIAGGDVSMISCSSSHCNAANNTNWQLDSEGRLVSGSNTNLCLTLANVNGPDVNLWQCEGAVTNGQFDYVASATKNFGTLKTRDKDANFGCLTNPDGGSSSIVLNTSRVGLPVYGIGGLAAIGGARLIYEYVEPQRTQILDLLFNATGGTAFQILKTEIEGDMDSSYGSGPSFRHSRGEAPSFKRGIYLPWLLGEAKSRQPNIGTYSLAWGEPGYVGQQTGGFLSEESLQYHIDYLVGVRDTYGYVFDITGIHNERPFSRQWTIALRAALDLNGFNSTKISVNDNTNCCCTDCQNFTDSSITTAAKNDPEFRKALGVIGLHSSSPLPSDYDWAADGKIFIQSEANDVDGPLIETADGSFPQWAPNAASPYGPGLEWPLHFLQNYAQGRNTGMIICPLSHAWTWAYGRHNHGTAVSFIPLPHPYLAVSPLSHFSRHHPYVNFPHSLRSFLLGPGTATSFWVPHFGRKHISLRLSLVVGSSLKVQPSGQWKTQPILPSHLQRLMNFQSLLSIQTRLQQRLSTFN